MNRDIEMKKSSQLQLKKKNKRIKTLSDMEDIVRKKKSKYSSRTIGKRKRNRGNI